MPPNSGILNPVSSNQTQFRFLTPGKYMLFVADEDFKWALTNPAVRNALKDRATTVQVRDNGETRATTTYLTRDLLQRVAKSADSIAWGSAVNGLRLGAAFGPDPSKPTLRVVFQNVGPAFKDVLTGAATGRGPIYDMKFIATAPDGKKREGLHSSAFSAVGGMVVPISVRLNAGETHELEFPLKDIIYTSQTTVRLDALTKQGYSVLVRFEVQQASAEWAKLSAPWLGTVSSA
jgi:hypothetical protein